MVSSKIIQSIRETAKGAEVRELRPHDVTRDVDITLVGHHSVFSLSRGHFHFRSVGFSPVGLRLVNSAHAWQAGSGAAADEIRSGRVVLDDQTAPLPLTRKNLTSSIALYLCFNNEQRLIASSKQHCCTIPV